MVKKLSNKTIRIIRKSYFIVDLLNLLIEKLRF